MFQKHLTESPEKKQQQIAHRGSRSDSAQSVHGDVYSPILQLQWMLGNQRVGQLIQSKRLTPQGKIIGLQQKLTVGAADDRYEQEADRVARQVLNTPDAVAANSMQRAMSPEEDKDKMLQTKSLAASITPFVQREMLNNSEEPEDKEKPVQAKSAESMSDSFEAGDDVETQISQSKGRGSPLPDPVRAYMEPRFGIDLSQVRVHTDSNAIQMNRDVGAQAFTHGSDIYFGAGHSPTNLELTAHELTHVVQQTGGVPLQTKRVDEASLANMDPSIQRTCTACTAEDREKKESDALSQQGKQTVADGRAVNPVALAAARFAARAAGALRISRDDKVDPQAALKADYAAAVKAKDWPQAATHLNGFTDVEIAAFVKKLSGDQAVELHKAWVGQILGPRGSKLLAPHLVGTGKYSEGLAAILRGEAITTVGLSSVTYDAGMGSNRFTTDRVAKTVKFGKSAFTGGYAKVVATVTDVVTRSISFIANAPASATAATTTTVNNAGKVVKTAKVPGGTVKVRTGVDYDSFGSAGFSVEYKGTSSTDSRWLQFIWREIIVTDAAKKTSRLAESITTTGGTYDLTTDPKSPNYNTDSASTTSPFYETAGTANRTADSTTMFDQPASVDAKVQAQFTAGATKVVSNAHFHTFLIRDMSVLHRFDIDVGWKYTSTTVPPRTTSVSRSQAATALPSRMKARLVAQYPKFDYIA